MKEVLIITNYFPPETGAASNRIFHLAEGLHARNFKVSVITPLPNYPRGEIYPEYRGRYRMTSVECGITVNRLWLYASNSRNKLKRLFSMLSFSFSLAWYLTFNKSPKTVIIQSPPLIVAFASILFLKSKRRKLILNVSDLWPLAGLELNAMKRNFLYSILEKIEGYNYKKANFILGQSEEILNHIESKVEDKQLALYRNYPNIDIVINGHYKGPQQKIKIVYAGLLGVAQGVLKLCKELDYSRIEFHIYGAGAEKEDIELYIQNNLALPINYHGELERKELHAVLPTYDMAIIPLLNRIYGSVPSKIFEFSKLGMPLLYFGGGEGESLVNTFDLGWTAEAGNYKALNAMLSKITFEMLNPGRREQIRNTAISNFDFDKQLNAVVALI